jgi:hypothetical protein
LIIALDRVTTASEQVVVVTGEKLES